MTAASDAVTRALATAEDDAIPELVAERRAMREELCELRDARARGEGVVSLEDERARRGRERCIAAEVHKAPRTVVRAIEGKSTRNSRSAVEDTAKRRGIILPDLDGSNRAT